MNGKKCEWVFIRKLFYEEDECEEYCESLPNGMKVNICKSVVPIDSATATTTAVVVPGSYFVAGDYRGGSIDSRSQGCVAADSIIRKGVKESKYRALVPIYYAEYNEYKNHFIYLCRIGRSKLRVLTLFL